MRSGAASRDHIVEGAADHVSEVGRHEGWREKIKGAGFNGLQVKMCVHDTSHDDHIYRLSSLLGLSHLPYAEKMLAAATEIGFKRVMIVQGIEGNEDAPTSRPCRAFLWELGQKRELRIDPVEYGLQPATAEEMAGGDAAANARIAEAVLSGEPGGHRDLVLLNAGLRIWLAERAASIAEGIEKAREAIDSGAARAKLKQLSARRG